MSRPWAVVVSAQLSRSDLKPAPFSATAPRIFKRSRVDRASLSSLVTTRISPLSSPAISRVSCFRSDRAPLIFSWKIRSQLTALSSATCQSAVTSSGPRMIEHRVRRPAVTSALITLRR
jgi:hypothetical protein